MPSPSPHLGQVVQLIRRGAYPQAISMLQQAVAAQPGQFEARLQLAKACLDWVQIQARMPLTDIEPEKLGGDSRHYLQLFESHMHILGKSHAVSHHVQSMLAMQHLIHARSEEALRCLKRASSKDPQNPDLLYNMGYALMELERYAEAEKHFRRLTVFHPGHGMGWQMLGEALRLAGNPEAALDCYRHAASLMPDKYQTYGALATALFELDRFLEAMEVLRAGLAGHPDNRDLHASMSNAALSTGNWTTGWHHYRYRNGQALGLDVDAFQAARTLRVQRDQGLGDELFFLRFAPALAARGVAIRYTTHPKLFPLLRAQSCLSGLEASASEKPGEYDVLVGDLPYLTGMRSASDVPPSLQLPLESERVERLREQLAGYGPPPYLGVTWQGGTPKTLARKGVWRSLHKEIPPQLLGKLAKDWPGTVIVLQRVPKPEDMALFAKALGRPFLDWSGLNDDLSEALAGLSLLDEYVGVSNTNMHLLAGIGKTARVLVQHPADWRWMAEGDESPWFPGFGVYRQSRGGSWEEALARLGRELAEKHKGSEKEQ